MISLEKKNYNMIILLFDQSRIIEQASVTYSPLGKAFEKQIETTESQDGKQIKAIEKHGKQLVKSNAVIQNTIMILKMKT